MNITTQNIDVFVTLLTLHRSMRRKTDKISEGIKEYAQLSSEFQTYEPVDI